MMDNFEQTYLVFDERLQFVLDGQGPFPVDDWQKVANSLNRANSRIAELEAALRPFIMMYEKGWKNILPSEYHRAIKALGEEQNGNVG